MAHWLHNQQYSEHALNCDAGLHFNHMNHHDRVTEYLQQRDSRNNTNNHHFTATVPVNLR